MSIIEKAMEKARLGLENAKPGIGLKARPGNGSNGKPGAGPGNGPEKGLPGPDEAGPGEAVRANEPPPHAGKDAAQRISPSPELIMAHTDTPLVGGEYRLLKEYILALRREEPDRSLFMVTSPMRNEGKTVISCNLAATLAREFDHTVLLVDADLRAPTCHKMMGISGRPKGLSDCLLHNTPLSEHLIHTGIGKFSMLCAGSPTNNPAELVTSKRMEDFLKEIKHRYPDRIIIIDTLPLVPFAESRALSRMVDGILLVVRENVTVKAHLESALRSLEGSPVLGIVYNGATSFGADKDIFELAYEY